MSRQTLYIHIGYHKTGTTSLQSFLGENRSGLAKSGICYPETSGDGTRDYFHKHLYFFNRIMAAHRSGNNVDHQMDPLINEIVKSGLPKAIISEESFSGLPGSIVKIFRKFSETFDVKIVAVVRRQDEFINSFYQQSIKDFGETLDFIPFLKSKNWQRLYYDKALGIWADCFGIENLRVISYSHKGQSGSLMSEILLPIFQGSSASGLIKDRRRHRSLPAICYEALRICNQSGMQGPDLALLKEAMRKSANRFGAEIRTAFPGLLDKEFTSPQSAQAILSEFRSSNLTLAQDYFGGADPFPDLSSSDIPENMQTIADLGDESAFQPKEVIAFLAFALAKMSQANK